MNQEDQDLKHFTPNQLQNEFARRDFLAYRKLISPKLKMGWFHREICYALEDFYEQLISGQKPVLILQAPPQHGKSRAIIDFISWVSGKNPDLETFYTAFSDRLGVRANLRLQRTYDSEIYKQIFPELKISSHGDKDSHGFTRNRNLLEYVGRDGLFRNTTVNGAITGETIGLGIIDDPLKGRKEANSVTIRDTAWDWLTDDFFTRFEENAGLLMILTRWHLDDPAGRLILEMPGVRVLNFPAIAEKGIEDAGAKYREIGEPLFPEHKSLEFLLKRKALMTSFNWVSLYQGCPIQVGGGLIKVEYFKIVPVCPEGLIEQVRYWDKACLIANTMVSTDKGKIPIQSIKIGDMVLTRKGFKKVLDSFLSKTTNEIVSVIFSNGSRITGTKDHPVFTKKRYWIDLSKLLYSDIIVTEKEFRLCQEKETRRCWNVFFKAADMCATKIKDIIIAMNGINQKNDMFIGRFIGIYGNRLMEIYPMAIISTTKTRTGIITKSKILNVSARRSTEGFMQKICHLRLRWQILHIEKKHLMLFKKESRSQKNTIVFGVKMFFMQKVLKRNTAHQNVKRGNIPVYDLTIESEHEFFANGTLVHNSTEGGGAFTAGVKVGKLDDGRFIILDVIKGQWSAMRRERRILQTAQIDKIGVQIGVEQEPGSGGMESAENTIRMLAGYNCYADKVTDSKDVRAEPFAAQVEAGNILLLRAEWNKEFIAESETFPDGKFKDMVDAAVGAFQKLSGVPELGFSEADMNEIKNDTKSTTSPGIGEKVW